MSTKRIKLVVAYDGTDFRGWAANPGQRTVRSTLTEAVRQISGEENEIIGASRTDSGAHAKGQVCHFDTANPMPPERWTQALNRRLPSDIRIGRSEGVPCDFHSRFSASFREYRYAMADGDPDPIRGRFCHDVWHRLDVGRMHEASEALIGVHDFRAYSEEIPADANTVREILRLKIERIRNEIRLTVAGKAFLRGMIRRIAGGLYEVGRGYRPADEIKQLLDPKLRDKLQWPVVLPANGLMLMRVVYGRHPKDFRNSLANSRENEKDNNDE
ncbi:MAG: tRNA pseudouridine synthase A [Fimbriimonadaceae bacterium]|nr:tRNA pseudouridine synthase A [Fimbriimonadaceae bacterium]